MSIRVSRILRIVSLTVISITFMLGGLPLFGSAVAQESRDWITAIQGTKGLPDEERKNAYERISFHVENWSVGKVVSRDPLAIVTEVSDSAWQADFDVKLHVWTGMLERVEQDLAVTWDEVMINEAGAVTNVKLRVDHLIKRYFDAEHQSEFRGKAYIGLYPWAFIPTDKEAASKGMDTVPNGGIIDLYGNNLDPEYVDITKTDSVKPFPAIPSQIRNKPKFPKVEIDHMPSDIAKHWAKEEIIALMRKDIIKGYDDGTIRPNRTLSRAEFISLLLRAIHIQPSKSDVTSTYPDAAQHWSSATVSAAELYEIIPSGDGSQLLEPDGVIPRIEMVVMLSNALRYLGLDLAFESNEFADTDGLLSRQQTALSQATGLELIHGFDDHTFRPQESLTRAQAFAVIARLVDIQ